MSLINKVDAIISNNIDLDDIGYFKNPIEYESDLNTIKGVDWKKLLNNPSKNSSSKTISELKQVSKLTQNRSNAELNLIHVVDQDPLELYYQFLLERDLKFPTDVFHRNYNILEHYTYVLKYYFNRARPAQIAPHHDIEIKVLETDTHHTPSYPSGHAMYSELAAHTLSDLYPHYTKDFFRLSEYCGLARILQGVHYPSDNAASKLACKSLYIAMKKGFENDERANKNTLDRQPYDKRA